MRQSGDVINDPGRPDGTDAAVREVAEEAGLKGSVYYADHPRLPLDQVMGVINLDTVGRLGNDKISVLGTGTASVISAVRGGM